MASSDVIDISKARVLIHGCKTVSAESLYYSRAERLLYFRLMRKQLAQSAQKACAESIDTNAWELLPHRWWVRKHPTLAAYELHLLVFTLLGRIEPTKKAAFRLYRAY